MRAYFFGNMYLSSIQQGIQAAHCVSEIFANNDHKYTNEKKSYLIDWVKNHKTMILLNGGFSSNLIELLDFFNDDNNPYPFGSFCEELDALNGALTCVGIILPEKIYETSRLMREGKLQNDCNSIKISLDGTITFTNMFGEAVIWKLTNWEVQMCKHLNQFNLAH